MPELPEVEALASDLHSRLAGRRIDRLDVTSFSALKTFDPPVTALAGTEIHRVTRYGKFLDIVTDEAHVVVHLALAGWIRWRPEAPGPPPARRSPIAARLVLSAVQGSAVQGSAVRDSAAQDSAVRNSAERSETGAGNPTGEGEGIDITEAGTKKGLAIYVVRDPSEVPGVANLGPEAMDLDEQAFTEILRAGGRSQIKRLLRDQSVIAGVGNAYSDEILHAAKMSPFHPAAMDPADAHRLYTALRSTLDAALKRAHGVAASELKREKKAALAVHGRFGEECPVCADTIQQVVYSDSSFQYCPTCQTGGKKLSDRGMDRLLR